MQNPILLPRYKVCVDLDYIYKFTCDYEISCEGRTECHQSIKLGEHIQKHITQALTHSPKYLATQLNHKILDSVIDRYLHAARHRIEIGQVLESIFIQIKLIPYVMQK